LRQRPAVRRRRPGRAAGQRALAQAGGDETWSAIVEETLRVSAPIGNFLGRYPLRDITVAGVTLSGRRDDPGPLQRRGPRFTNTLQALPVRLSPGG
jgi:hypothetical protein